MNPGRVGRAGIAVAPAGAALAAALAEGGSAAAAFPGAKGKTAFYACLLAVGASAVVDVVVGLPPRKRFGSSKPQVTHPASAQGSTADAVPGDDAALVGKHEKTREAQG
jgi:hypothetical protein